MIVGILDILEEYWIDIIFIKPQGLSTIYIRLTSLHFIYDQASFSNENFVLYVQDSQTLHKKITFHLKTKKIPTMSVSKLETHLHTGVLFAFIPVLKCIKHVVHGASSPLSC